MSQQNLKSETQAERHEGKSRVVLQISHRETRATTCIKKLTAWPYDIGFSSSNRPIKAYDVGYNMSRKNLNYETQAERYEGKSKVVSQKRK